MKSRKRVILPFILLALFALFQANSIFNLHSHYVNGVSFTHSHPNKGEHTHSNADILLIHRLSVFHSTNAGINAFHFNQPDILYVLEWEKNTPSILNSHWCNSALRAPPHRFS